MTEYEWVRNFEYKVVFAHDGVEEVLYVLNKDDLNEILRSISNACARGTYRDCNIKYRKL